MPHPTPYDLIAAWPRRLPVAAAVVDGRTLVAVPTGEAVPGARLAPPGVHRADLESGASPGPGWIGWLSYDLGRTLEPTAAGETGSRRDRAWPLGLWLRCPGGLLYDHASRAWSRFGEPRAARAAETAAADATTPHRFTADGIDPRAGRDRYVAGVREALERIAAGECYQVNLARRLSGAFRGHARAAFAALASQAAPRHGFYAESIDTAPAHAVLGCSPELFLDTQGRALRSRPMKGTRPIGGSEHELFGAEKDRAELDMIVDLMRNDLGRVAEFGSVRIAEPRTIERHPGGGVLQAVAEVRAHRRRDATLEDVLRATFPPGSVTGAPKIRAMRAIDELESAWRGPYCGAGGYVGDDGRASLCVAIRTAGVLGQRDTDRRFTDATLDYWVGAGIVADSDPDAEFEETVHKAAPLVPILEHAAPEPAR